MQIRTGYLGPHDSGGLLGFKSAHDEICEKNSPQARNFELVFYSAVFQAGIDRFLIDDVLKDKFSTLADDRVRILKPETMLRHWSPIVFFFREELIFKDSKDQDVSLKQIVWFLMDLYTCMATDSCKISTLGTPPLEPLIGTKYEVLFEPLSLILKELTPHQISTPILVSTLSHDSLKRLEEILTGKLFRAVRNAHDELREFGTRPVSSLAKIESESKRLVLKYPELLKISSASLSLLQATPKIIDLAFGKLAGVLGEAFFDTAGKFFKKEKNVIVYHSEKVLRNQLRFALDSYRSKK